ncbi:MAG: hypothetical protein OHK0053_17510 [Microscillaceae bacterium]
MPTGNLTFTGKQKEQFRDALLAAFPTEHDLNQLLVFELEENLLNLVGAGPLKIMAFQLIEWAETQGRLEELLIGAIRQNPGNPRLKKFAQSLEIPFFIQICQELIEVGAVETVFKVLLTLKLPKNNRELLINLRYRWESLLRKEEEDEISEEELANEKAILASNLSSFLEHYGSSPDKIANTEYYRLYPYLKEMVAWGVEAYAPPYQDCLLEGLSPSEAMEIYATRLRELLRWLVEMAQRYAGNFEKKTYVYGANIMLLVNAKDPLASKILARYPGQFMFFDRASLANLLGILYSPEALKYADEAAPVSPSIALPIHKIMPSENTGRVLPGAPFAAVYGDSILRDVAELRQKTEGKLKNEMEAYFSGQGLGAHIRSLASFRIGTASQPIGVLNIDCNQTDLLGHSPDLYPTFITNLDPILRKIAGMVEQFARFYTQILAQG